MKKPGYGLLAMAALTIQLFSHSAKAEEPPTSWQIKKCQIYRSAWKELPRVMDTTAFTDEFNALNEEFMASNCLANTKICPENEVELKAANFLTIASMNGGTASTFPPFRC